MPYGTYYKRGDYNAYCDLCQRKFKASQLRLTWNNLFVCAEDFDTRNPQDKVRVVREDPPLKIVRDRTVKYIDATYDFTKDFK